MTPDLMNAGARALDAAQARHRRTHHGQRRTPHVVVAARIRALRRHATEAGRADAAGVGVDDDVVEHPVDRIALDHLARRMRGRRPFANATDLAYLWAAHEVGATVVTLDEGMLAYHGVVCDVTRPQHVRLG